MTPIRHADLPVSPWKNGAGRKADIADGEGWTVGYAWLDRDAPFSDYAGHTRTITLVEGPGFELRDPQGRAVVQVSERFAPAEFDGGLALNCVISGDVCRVMNVMTQDHLCRHEVEIVGEGRQVAAAEAGATRVLVVLRGPLVVAAEGQSVRLESFDAMMLNAEARLAADGDARASLITLRRI